MTDGDGALSLVTSVRTCWRVDARHILGIRKSFENIIRIKEIKRAKEKRDWMTESRKSRLSLPCNDDEMDVAIRQDLECVLLSDKRQEKCHVNKTVVVWKSVCRGIFWFSFLSFLSFKKPCMYTAYMFNEWCCYLSFLSAKHRKKKQIGCGQKLHKWVNIHLVLFSFCPIIT